MGKNWIDASEAINKYEQQSEEYLEGERNTRHKNYIKARNRHMASKKEGGDKWVQKDQQTP
ncbi:hypothetical protein NYR90_20135 [Clostridioides phage Hain-Saunders-2022a]|nr:hypothetical protein NYR90_20135 [Clostridioides phage Hain-Saunders-2022a]